MLNFKKRLLLLSSLRGGDSLSPEVKDFIARVEADGGTVESPECIGTLDAEKVTYPVASGVGKFYSQKREVLPEDIGYPVSIDDYIVARAEEASRVNKDGNIEVVPANVSVLDYGDNFEDDGLIEGLVASWSFEDDFVDSINGHNGVAVGVVPFIDAQVNKGIDLTAGDSNVNVPHHSDFTFTDGAGNDKAFSISFWVNKPVIAQGVILTKGLGTDWYIASTNNNILLYLYSGNTSNRLTITAESILSYDSLWRNIIITYEPITETIQFYRDGVAFASTKVESGVYSGITAGTNKLAINAINNGTRTKISVDELHIWKDRVLTQEDVTAIYDKEVAGFNIPITYPLTKIQDGCPVLICDSVLPTTINQSGDADSFDSTALVMYARIKALSDDGTNRFLSIHDATFQNALMMGFSQAGRIQVFTVQDGAFAFNGGANGYDIVNEYHRVAYVMKANRFELWIDGVKVAEDLTLPAFPVGTFTTDTISSADGGGQFFGKVAERKTKKGAYWDMKHLTETGEFKEITIESVLENASVIYDLQAPAFHTPWTNAVLEVEKVAGDRIFVFLDDDGKISGNSLTSTKDNIIDSAVTLNTWMGADDTYVRAWYGMTPDNIIDTDKIAVQVDNGKQPQLAKLGVLEIKGGEVAIDFTADVRYLQASANTDLDSGNEFTILTVSSNNTHSLGTILANRNESSGARFVVFNDRSSLFHVLVLTDKEVIHIKNAIAADNDNQKILSSVYTESKEISTYLNGSFQLTDAYLGDYLNIILQIGVERIDSNSLNGTLQNITILKGNQTDNLEALHLWLNDFYNVY